jgi:hypothetical protein
MRVGTGFGRPRRFIISRNREQSIVDGLVNGGYAGKMKNDTRANSPPGCRLGVSIGGVDWGPDQPLTQSRGARQEHQNSGFFFNLI